MQRWFGWERHQMSAGQRTCEGKELWWDVFLSNNADSVQNDLADVSLRSFLTCRWHESRESQIYRLTNHRAAILNSIIFPPIDCSIINVDARISQILANAGYPYYYRYIELKHALTEATESSPTPHRLGSEPGIAWDSKKESKGPNVEPSRIST